MIVEISLFTIGCIAIAGYCFGLMTVVLLYNLVLFAFKYKRWQK